MRYNPPPNWPPPPAGWSPPPGWEPDPSWGPAPDDWPLWVPDARADQTGYLGGGHPAPTYGGAAAPPPGRSGSTTAVLLAVLGVVALVAGVVAAVLLVRDHGSSTTASPTSVPAGSTTTSAPTGSSDAAPTCPSDGGGKADPKALGTGGDVAGFCATVTAVVPDDTASLQAGNQFNEPPTNGQYMRVDIAATYTGAGSAKASLEIYLTLVGGDGKRYDDFDCDATFDDKLTFAGETPSGETTRGAFCLDVPARAVQGGVLTLSSSSSDDEIYWQIR